MAGPVEVTGVEEAQAAYLAIASDARDMTAPNRLIADTGAQEARARAPVRTGALSASIGSDATATEAILTVGVPYWWAVEFGTKFVHARRMMRDGADAMTRAAPAAYEARMSAIIAKRAE